MMSLIKKHLRSSKMVQQEKVLATKTDYLSSIPGPCMGARKAASCPQTTTQNFNGNLLNTLMTTIACTRHFVDII